MLSYKWVEKRVSSSIGENRPRLQNGLDYILNNHRTLNFCPHIGQFTAERERTAYMMARAGSGYLSRPIPLPKELSHGDKLDMYGLRFEVFNTHLKT
jgi:hypothetical protein